ncbi:hypothetical protein HWB26_gp30 [Lentibacter phage vB_LenP_ICBM2]|uniref:Uncharacterized protein n=1 Tax=Lentibacter phage vB_LenP_ICBM2 TaxID=2847823 RepID=A0A3G2YRR4_9CAUD|nr:hypothetical protein HWB26_gp30 [Lentibacter phage vB_LenP_ICBM2]AYP28091.1 hypothetical protein vBLenPICBM2__30 [Lentibacter phage vB_LenP_ICBM2]
MPKGQTSRPNNRKEKKAAATLKNLKTATKGFSSTNKKTVMSGKTATAAKKTIKGRDTKAIDREYGKAVGKSGMVRTGTIGDYVVFGKPKKKNK